jgi:hypothetical protein
MYILYDNYNILEKNVHNKIKTANCTICLFIYKNIIKISKITSHLVRFQMKTFENLYILKFKP